MPFSILFRDPVPAEDRERAEPPECFRDLCLDQIIAAVTQGRDEYDLAPFFHVLLGDVASVRYRQEVFQDLEDPSIRRAVETFAGRMRTLRSAAEQEEKLHHPLQKRRWHLDAASLYCEAIDSLAADLEGVPLGSRGLAALREHLTSYRRSARLGALRADTLKLKASLDEIQYCVRLHERLVEVTRYAGQLDYAAQVTQTFEKFMQADAKAYAFRADPWPGMNHIEAAILEGVAQLHPAVFAALAQYCDAYRDYVDPTLRAFDREVQVYLAFLAQRQGLESAGLPFCYPAVSADSKAAHAREVFDLALALRLVEQHREVVTNDFALHDPERVLVVSGANQGGKTTFARALGQLHYLAALGCPVPGREVALPLCDRIFTHFERGEQMRSLTGRLEESLLSMRSILEQASSRSLLIMNESFGATTLQDALFLSKQILQQVLQRGLLCVCVTFLDELALLGPCMASFVATVDPEDPARRTFKVIRQPPTGVAYALAIARKYGLTRERVRQRIAS